MTGKGVGGSTPSKINAETYDQGARKSQDPPISVSPALGAAGQALYDAVVASYDLRQGDEMALLVELAHCCDEVAALREAIAETGWTVPGSKAQPRPNPLLATLNATRTTMIRLTSQLGLPDDGEDPAKASPTSRKAAAAARARWAGHREAEAEAEAYRRGQA